MNKTLRGILDIVLFLIAFVVIQIGAALLCGAVKWPVYVAGFISGAVTIVLFMALKWSPFSNEYLRSRPWATIFWVIMLTLGTILPSEWILEQVNIQMPEATQKLFEDIMGKPWGYLALGILAPLAEEMVFRGAIERTLLKLFSRKWHWGAIAISAAIFGAVHGNVPQGLHAFVIGLIIGWMYYRTDSIVPGVVFHWINNTVAYVMFNIMPQMNDGKLIDLFHGDQKMMIGGLFFSLCIFIPSLLQLAMRMKKVKN